MRKTKKQKQICYNITNAVVAAAILFNHAENQKDRNEVSGGSY